MNKPNAKRKIVCVLYDDPVDGYPPNYARDGIPTLAGYDGDVSFPQPPPKDHPWRQMSHHAMTPHTSGTSLSAQARYAAGVREILECWFDGKPIRDEYLIVQGGKLAGAGAHSYSEGDATGGSDEAAQFKTAD